MPGKRNKYDSGSVIKLRTTIIPKLLGNINNLLRIDSLYFIKGGMYNFFQQVVGILIGLLLTYLLGHFISQKVYGEYNLLLSYISMLAFLGLPGVDSALIQSASKGYDSSYIRSFQLKFKFSFIGIVVLLFISLFYISKNLSFSYGLIVCALFFPFLNSYNIYAAFLTAKRKFAASSVIASISSIAFFVIMSLSIFWRPNTLGIITAHLLGLSIPSIFAFIYSKRYVQKSTSIDTEVEKYGSFLSIVSILPWISGNIGNVILASLLGPEVLAIYIVANGLLAEVQKNFIVFYKPISAKLAEQSRKEHLNTLRLHGWKFLGIGGLLAVGMWLALPLFISFFYSYSYQPAIRYGNLLSLSLLILPISWVLSDILLYEKKYVSQLFLNTLPHITKIVLYIILIPLWKVEGLIVAFLIERVISFLIPIAALSRIGISKGVSE